MPRDGNHRLQLHQARHTFSLSLHTCSRRSSPSARSSG
jgi:hypothetical protein